MKVRFLKPAQSELDDAVEWYDSQSFGLGTQFLDDLDRAVRRIVSYPLSCPEIEPNLRRCLFSRFPYGAISLFDREFIKSGIFDKELSKKTLHRSFELRQKGNSAGCP